MKSKKCMICFLLITIIINISLVSYINDNDFSNSFYVITEDMDSNVNYYEVGDRENIRKTKSFESEPLEIYYTSSCYSSYIDRKKNKVLNELTLDDCKIKDESKNEIEIEGDFERIVTLVAGLEHSIMTNKIIKLEDEYYTVVELNVNWWIPYKLYKFNQEKNSLDLIYTFDGEDVIGIRR